MKLSLRTREPKEALNLSRYLAYHAQKINWHLAKDMDYVEIQQHLKTYFATMLAKRKKMIDKNGPLNSETLNAIRSTSDFLQYAIETNEDDFLPDESIDNDLLAMIRTQKLNIANDSPAYQQLREDFKLPYLSYCREVMAYNAGLRNYDLSKVNLSSQPTQTKITLKRATDDFVSERQRGEAWTARTLKDRTAQLNLLCELLGEDNDISAIDALRAAEVKKTLQALPKNRNKSPKTRGLRLKEMIAVKDVEKIDARTVNEYLTVYQSLFGWAEHQGYVQKNVFNGLQIKIGKRKKKPRKPFSREQVKAILNNLPKHTPEKSGTSFRYWGVMLAIYTGARLNEIAQLTLADILKENDVWYLNVTDEGDDENTSLKNEHSKRRIPIHDALLAAGFLERIQELKDIAETRLFPDLNYQEGHGYGRGLTRWVNTKFLVDLGIKDTGLTFHSFRHSFITNLRQVGVELPTVQELVGHSKDVVTETVYNASAYPLPLLRTAINKLTYI